MSSLILSKSIAIENNFTANDDYNPGVYSIIIPANETIVSFDIPIVNDDMLKGNEDFDIAIMLGSLPNDVSKLFHHKIIASNFKISFCLTYHFIKT